MMGGVAVGAAIVLVAGAARPASARTAQLVHGGAAIGPATRPGAEHLGSWLPEAVVLLKLALGAGSSVPHALERVGSALGGSVGTAFLRATARIDDGWLIGDAIGALREDLPAVADPLVVLLRSAAIDGAATASGFDALIVELRDHRRRTLELRARRVPVLLLFPLVLCLLPAFVLVGLVPLMANALGGIAW